MLDGMPSSRILVHRVWHFQSLALFGIDAADGADDGVEHVSIRVCQVLPEFRKSFFRFLVHFADGGSRKSLGYRIWIVQERNEIIQGGSGLFLKFSEFDASILSCVRIGVFEVLTQFGDVGGVSLRATGQDESGKHHTDSKRSDREE